MEWDIETQVGYIFRFWISNELNLLINSKRQHQNILKK